MANVINGTLNNGIGAGGFGITVDVTLDFEPTEAAVYEAIQRAIEDGVPGIVAKARAAFSGTVEGHRRKAPADGKPHNRTGHMRESIGSTIGDHTAVVFCSDYRARFVEFGTKGYVAGARKRGGRGGIAALNSAGGKGGKRKPKPNAKQYQFNVPARAARPFIGPAVFGDRAAMIERIKTNLIDAHPQSKKMETASP